MAPSWLSAVTAGSLRRAGPFLVALVLVGLSTGDCAVAWADATAWRAPVSPLRVAGAFDYDRAHPFAAGRRRGVDLTVVAGAVVRAPCAGRVAFAGRVPDGGRGVSLVCGGVRATLVGLGVVDVRPGRRVARGAAVGRVDGGGVLRFGARAADDRWGYRDPLALLGRDLAPPVVGPRPSGRPRRGSPRPAVAPPGPAPAPRVAPAFAPVARAPTGSPSPVLLAGVALLAVGIGTGGLVRARRRPRPVARPAGLGADAAGRPGT